MLGLMIAAAIGSTAGQSLHRYTNVRYGYSTCFPVPEFKAQGVSDSGDGQVFKATSGAEIRVWGRYATGANPSADFSADVSDNAKDLAGNGGKVTYRVDRPTWAVFSGTSASQIFWSKEMLKGDRIVVVQFVYPSSLRARYQSIPATLNRCSMVGTAPF